MLPETSIGLTENEIAGCTEDLATSESGLFLDQLPGLGADWFAPNGNYGTCEDAKSYISRLLKARKEARGLTIEALQMGLHTEHALQKHTFAGAIGQKQGTGAATGNTFEIRTAHHPDAFLKISQVGVIASGEGTAIVTLTYPDSIPQDFTIEVTQTGYSSVPADLKLPLDGTTYTFEVATTGTVRLQRNNIGCGCGARDRAMFSYMQFSGSTANGISLQASVTCETKDFLSRTYAADENVRNVLARMLYFRSGVVLCDYIMGQSQPNDTDADLEYVKARRDNFLGEFNERLSWLVESGISVKGSACFACSGAKRYTI